MSSDINQRVLNALKEAKAKLAAVEQQKAEAVAIIGMAGRFSGAKNIDEYWHNLKSGINSIRFLNDEELRASGVSSDLIKNPNYVRAYSSFDDVEYFAADFFGYSPLEAEVIDPQHRVFLESAYEALENAGYDSDRTYGKIGVFAGSALNSYLLNLYTSQELQKKLNNVQVVISNVMGLMPTRVSYKLNLKGASCGIQTGCSTSLVAVHLACQSLLNNESDMALAGGITINAEGKQGYLYQEGSIASPDGYCRAFDRSGKGTVFGNGVGIVVLKRLSQAIKDCDNIWAVIKGSAVNNDGSDKVGLTAPSVSGQAEVIQEALKQANISPDTISYIEAHGTGTSLGDPIELAALNKVFRNSNNISNSCAIGSVKTNIGHLDAAAGISGLIKTVLSLHHQQIPPSLNFQSPNPNINFDNSPFYVNTKLTEWQTNGTPRRAGVSSFGMGGTNAHVVLEEAPLPQPLNLSLNPSTSPPTPLLRGEGRNTRRGEKYEERGEIRGEGRNTRRGEKYEERGIYVLVISAKTETALDAATVNLANYLKHNPNVDLTNVAYTLQMGRKAFNYRRMVVCHDVGEAIQLTISTDRQQALINPPVTFMFSGQGSQYVGMARELYQTESVFKENCDRCFQILEQYLDVSLKDIIFSNNLSKGDSRIAPTTPTINQTKYAQPAIFTIEYALAQLWMSWGIKPENAIGHSIGEYVAATIAGVFSLEDALKIVAIRGQLMQQCPPGAMLSVAMSANDTVGIIHELSLQKDLSLAVINAPELCVISGTEKAIANLASTLSQKGIACRQLHTSHGFHSAMMDGILDEFITSFDDITLHPPQLPFISNVTGTWITSEKATNPQYWAKHLRETVRFSEGIQTILENPNRILLEIGAGKTLATLAKQQQIITESNLICLTSLPSAKQKNNTDEISNEDSDFIFNTLGRLWLSGIEIDWRSLYKNQTPYRIPLPTYPFERKRYWVDRNAIDYTNTNLLNKNTESKTKEVIKIKKPDLKDWCYIPSWQRNQPLTNSSLESVEKYTCLLFADDNLLSQELQVNLKQLGHNVISVSTGSQFVKDSDSSYHLNPESYDDYVSLISNLQQQDKIPQKTIYLWSLSNVETFHETSSQDFQNLIYLTQSLTSQHLTKPLQLSIITNDIQEVTGTEKLDPYKSMVLGACQVIPQEYPQIITHNIDLKINNLDNKLVLSNLIKDILTLPQENTIAYRNNYKWHHIIHPFPITESQSASFKQQGTYLIAGDLVEGLGLMYASYLAKEYQANLILIGRENLPPQLEWQQWLKNNQNHVAYNLINSLQQLSTSGTKLLFISANLTDESAIKPLITEAKNKFINIDGVIHAGTMGDDYTCSILTLTGSEIEKQLQIKVIGLITLEKALANTKLDFFLLQSSLSSVVGGVGFAAYTAANVFMDNYAAIKNKEGNTAWYSINWDGYDSDRLSVEEKAYSPVNKIAENKNNSTGLDLVDLAITPDEAWEISKRVLANDVSQVIVSPTDLQSRIEQWIKPKTLAEIDKIMAAKSLNALANQKKADVTAEYVAPRNEIEIAVVKAMEELLGINTIGVNDNFFELGGHSLLAIQIVSRLRDEFEIGIPMREFLFESPTAAKIAHVINNKLLEDRDNDEIEKLLNEVENLSDDEVKAMLNNL